MSALRRTEGGASQGQGKLESLACSLESASLPSGQGMPEGRPEPFSSYGVGRLRPCRSYGAGRASRLPIRGVGDRGVHLREGMLPRAYLREERHEEAMHQEAEMGGEA